MDSSCNASSWGRVAPFRRTDGRTNRPEESNIPLFFVVLRIRLIINSLLKWRNHHHHKHHHHHHHHHHKHQGLNPLICSFSRVTAARVNASSVFQLFSFLVVCSGMISKAFGFVAFFASVKAISVCIHLSVRCIWRHFVNAANFAFVVHYFIRNISCFIYMNHVGRSWRYVLTV